MAHQENDRQRRNFKKCFDEMQVEFERARVEMEQMWRKKQEQHMHEIARLK